jgi:hypothetical protein
MTVTHVSQAPSVDPSAASPQKAPAPRPQPPTPSTDTAQISSSALMAAKAAVQEATETEAQTIKEARAGDQQAQRLLAKYAAGKTA